MQKRASGTTMCPMNCHPTLCGMTVTLADDGAVEIAGNEANPDSRGFLCMRGRAAHQIVGNPGRLLQPLIRKHGTRVATNWAATLDLIADRMAAVGREAVGLWQGHGNAANDYGFGLKRGQVERFANLYGCEVWNPAMICWGLGGLGIGLTGALETTAKEEIGDLSDLIVLWGANTVSQAHTMREVERAKRRGAYVVTIDIRHTEAGALADERFLIRPGQDADLALSLMHVLFEEGLADRAFLAEHCVGAEAFEAHLHAFPPEWAAARTGIDAEAIRALARRIASAQAPVIVLGGSSIHKGRNGWQAARAISCIPAVVGAYGRPGAGLGPRHGARSPGAGFSDISAADRRVAPQRIPNQMARIVEAIESGEIRVLIVIGSNLVSSFPDAGRMRAALARLDLLVAYEIFDNELTRDLADIVLPGTIWLEEVGAKATNTHVHLCERLLEPAGEARPAIEIYRGLAQRLGVEDVYPWPNQEAAMDAVLDHPAAGHATVAKIRAAGGSWPLRVATTGHAHRVFATPSGKVELFSERATAHGLPPLPMPSETAEPDPRYPLELTHGRSFAHFHGFYDHGAALPDLAAREAEPSVWIAPGDAGSRAISDGAAIELVNDRGRFVARAKVTPRIPAGTLWCRDGWPGLNTLTRLDPVVPETALDLFPFSVGQSHFGAMVEVRAL